MAKIIVRAFSLYSQNYVHMTLICVQELNTFVNVIIGCQTAEILKLKVAKTQVKLRNEFDCFKTITSVFHMPVGRSALVGSESKTIPFLLCTRRT